MKLIKIFLFVCFTIQAEAQNPQLHLINTAIPSNIRTLSAVNDSVVWIAGSKGYVGRSLDGGKTFLQLPVAGMDSADFRTLYAFNESTAVVAGTGYPARVFYMNDGRNWNEVYVNAHPEAFIDGVDFWNEREGILYGDPLDGHLMLLRTSDGGRSWQEMTEASRPMTAPGEASFAASGTAIRCYGENKVIIATGGTLSRILISTDRGLSWTTHATPILQGEAGTGIFSVDFFDEELGVIVGGDYTRDTLKTDHVFFTADGGWSWQSPINPTGGYRECVAFIDSKTLIAVGPTGIDLSVSAARNWEPISDQKGLHVIRKARNGKSIFVAGRNLFGIINFK